MGLNHSPSIVTNGLTSCLDAGNSKSYPGSGTTLTDLTGNGINGTLTGSVTYSSSNGGIFSIPNGHYISIPAAAFTLSGDFTIETWFRLTSNPSNFPSAVFSSWGAFESSAESRYIVFVPSSLTINAELKGGTTVTHQNSIVVNSWYHVALVRRSNVYQTYLNAIPSNTTATSSTSLTMSIDNWIGSYSQGGGNSIKGDIAAFKVYSTYGLSAIEVLQNFNALRGRFGL
jgi:hypothetical protein